VSSWRALAAAQAGGFYLRFVTMLINDAIYQLDESLKLLPAVRESRQPPAAVSSPSNKACSLHSAAAARCFLCDGIGERFSTCRDSQPTRCIARLVR
jgi:hypothetical protein